MERYTAIWPSSRAIREQFLALSGQNAFLPNYLTIAEFIQRACIVEGFSRIDEDTRTLLLLEATEFSAFSGLNIERNFYTFTQNSSYIFRLFEELSGEKVVIDALQSADTYGEYEEHLSILQTLYARYRSLCFERKILDPIFLPELYRLNVRYVKSLGKILLYVEGYLNGFELELFKACAEHIEVELVLETSRFNTKLQRKFTDAGIALKPNTRHCIDLKAGVVRESEAVNFTPQITSEHFGERLLQVAYIKERIYHYVSIGCRPERIAVVLPDESFASYLYRFDEQSNFNFAMGISLKEGVVYKSLKALCDFLDNPTVQNRHRAERMEVDPSIVKGIYHEAVLPSMLKGLLEPLLRREHNAAMLEACEEEFYFFDKLLVSLETTPLKSALHLLLNRLAKRTVDDVRGGKITVLGVLETRMVSFDAVIVIDFNERFVPRQSTKDIFLNSATRKLAGLPSTSDREALQKLYYYSLFVRSRHVAIAYVESADAVPSRFLMQLGIKADRTHDDEQWAQLLFRATEKRAATADAVIAEYDFTAQPLSASALKSFLTCRRRFYHRYFERLKPHEIERDLPPEHAIGTTLHEALKTVYETAASFHEPTALSAAIAKALKACGGKSVLERFQLKLWQRRLEPFVANEITRFASGAVVSECEAYLQIKYKCITLEGHIDRIDRKPDGTLEVLDYKSGNYSVVKSDITLENAVDFQLEFYYLLAQTLGPVSGCGYYDLKSGEIVPERYLEAKLERLEGILDAMAETKLWNFIQTDNLLDCQYCDYVHLCGREL